MQANSAAVLRFHWALSFCLSLSYTAAIYIVHPIKNSNGCALAERRDDRLLYLSTLIYTSTDTDVLWSFWIFFYSLVLYCTALSELHGRFMLYILSKIWKFQFYVSTCALFSSYVKILHEEKYTSSTSCFRLIVMNSIGWMFLNVCYFYAHAVWTCQAEHWSSQIYGHEKYWLFKGRTPPPLISFMDDKDV